MGAEGVCVCVAREREHIDVREREREIERGGPGSVTGVGQIHIYAIRYQRVRVHTFLY